MLARLATLQKIYRTPGSARMWTFTVDPARYNHSSEQAFRHIRDTRRIAKTAEKLGWNKNDHYWCAVLEWHESGMPHWHIMLWSPRKKPLFQSKHDVQDIWGANCQFEDRQGTHVKPANLIKYLSKYISKVNDHPTPDWVLDTHTKVRMVSSSKAWGPVTTYSTRHKDPLYERNADADAQYERKTHRQAHRECNTTTNIIQYIADVNGELRARYQLKLPLSPRLVTRYLKAKLRRKISLRDLTRIIPDSPEYEHLTRLITKVKMALT